MPRDLASARLRSRLEARVLISGAARNHELFGADKAAAIGAMTGTVVELGPGTGANMRYYRPGVKVIGIEPNPHMHEYLQQQAAKHGVDLEIRTLRGEGVDVADGEADHVVATLVLCGVDDPTRVVAEARRILRPGGTYFFVEHVGAPRGTLLRRIQDLVMRPHRWVFNGCEVNRDTADVLRSAGFSELSLRDVDCGLADLHTRSRIVGTAVR